jgi:membrane protease YdiL (CAAX protease family)
MFNNISHITTARSAIYITGFVFGIIHLAIISLLWLVPIGLIFAWLRWRYNTLWYGIIGHFVYNLCITMIEYYNII